MKYPVIDGREIVPVRLIPFIANAWLGQEILSGILANRLKVSGWPYPSDHDQFEVNVYDEVTGRTELTKITRAKLIGPKLRDNRVHAYHLNDDGIPFKMLASEWEAIYEEILLIEPLQRKKEEKNGVPDSKKSAWKLKVTRILPPGVFLWRDEFDLLWEAHIKTFSKDTTRDPPDFRKINHDAYLRPEYRKLVWEGFEHLMPGISAETALTSEKHKNNSTTILHIEPEPERPEVKPLFDLSVYVNECWKAEKSDEQIVYDLIRDYGFMYFLTRSAFSLCAAMALNTFEISL